MSFLEHLSDDQLALLWSALAIVFCFGVLAVTPGIREWAANLMKPNRQTSLQVLSRNKHVPTH